MKRVAFVVLVFLLITPFVLGDAIVPGQNYTPPETKPLTYHEHHLNNIDKYPDYIFFIAGHDINSYEKHFDECPLQIIENNNSISYNFTFFNYYYGKSPCQVSVYAIKRIYKTEDELKNLSVNELELLVNSSSVIKVFKDPINLEAYNAYPNGPYKRSVKPIIKPVYHPINSTLLLSGHTESENQTIEPENKTIEIKPVKICPLGSINENETCKKTLSNGRIAEIKIMPETASQMAIQRLGQLDFNVQLKEIGNGNESKAVYDFSGEKDGKLFFLFKVKGKVTAQVDSQTGEVISVKKPWWSFLASGL